MNRSSHPLCVFVFLLLLSSRTPAENRASLSPGSSETAPARGPLPAEAKAPFTPGHRGSPAGWAQGMVSVKCLILVSSHCQLCHSVPWPASMASCPRGAQSCLCPESQSREGGRPQLRRCLPSVTGPFLPRLPVGWRPEARTARALERLSPAKESVNTSWEEEVGEKHSPQRTVLSSGHVSLKLLSWSRTRCGLPCHLGHSSRDEMLTG